MRNACDPRLVTAFRSVRQVPLVMRRIAAGSQGKRVGGIVDGIEGRRSSEQRLLAARRVGEVSAVPRFRWMWCLQGGCSAAQRE